MDELKLKTKFMRGLISKLLSSEIRKKFGYNVNVYINVIEVSVDENKTRIHINADAETNNDVYMKFTKFIE